MQRLGIRQDLADSIRCSRCEAYLGLLEVFDLFRDFKVFREQLRNTRVLVIWYGEGMRKGKARGTFAISPGGFGSIVLRLRTTSAHRMPERERMMMDGVPSFLMFFGSGGHSAGKERCQGEKMWGEMGRRTFLDECRECGEVPWFCPLRRGHDETG